MSIRPVEFSGVVQRSQDISSLKQNEDNFKDGEGLRKD